MKKIKWMVWLTTFVLMIVSFPLCVLADNIDLPETDVNHGDGSSD